MSRETSQVIAEQNDQFRQLAASGDLRAAASGKFVMTQVVAALDQEQLGELLVLVRDYDQFTPDNDPYGEHDFGSIEYEGEKYFWKMDYYDLNYEFGSEEPANPAATKRVLTLMLASEY